MVLPRSGEYLNPDTNTEQGVAIEHHEAPVEQPRADLSRRAAPASDRSAPSLPPPCRHVQAEGASQSDDDPEHDDGVDPRTRGGLPGRKFRSGMVAKSMAAIHDMNVG
jgi:hypothetical protein